MAPLEAHLVVTPATQRTPLLSPILLQQLLVHMEEVQVRGSPLGEEVVLQGVSIPMDDKYRQESLAKTPTYILQSIQ
jgi:hypothetical protein